MVNASSQPTPLNKSLVYFHLLTSNFYHLEVVLEWFCKQKQIVRLNKSICCVHLSIYRLIDHTQQWTNV